MGWGRRRHYLLVGATLAGALLGVSLARRTDRLEVRGDSMRPVLEPGDRVLVVRTGRFRPGRLVALADPRVPARLVVKRVTGVSAAGVTVVGDNRAASTDSRHYGPVPRRSVRGRVVYRYWPEPRRGRL